MSFSIQVAPLPPSQNNQQPWLWAVAPRLGEEFTAPRDDWGLPTAGKWLIFAPSSQIDALWEKIVALTQSDTLGIAAKVSTIQRSLQPGQHIICVYALDWRDLPELHRLLHQLRQLLPAAWLHFKRDLETVRRIYHKKESIFVSPPNHLDFYTTYLDPSSKVWFRNNEDDQYYLNDLQSLLATEMEEISSNHSTSF